MRKALVDGIVKAYVLHRVLYPQVHGNGFKIKIKKMRVRVLSDMLSPGHSRARRRAMRQFLHILRMEPGWKAIPRPREI